MDCTVVILSHRKHFLPMALQSALDQTAPCQVIVQYCPDYFAGKLNDAVRAAKGEFVVILCDDDLLAPTYVERCLHFGQYADVIYTDRYMFKDGQRPEEGFHLRMHGDGFPENHGYPTQMTPDMFTFGSPLPMTIMVRRSLWEQLGGYDEVPHADTEFWFRCVQAKARLAYVAEPLFWYRQHEGQQSVVDDSMLRALHAFHAKHYDTFGITLSEPDATGRVYGLQTPPLHRITLPALPLS